MNLKEKLAGLKTGLEERKASFNGVTRSGASETSLYTSVMKEIDDLLKDETPPAEKAQRYKDAWEDKEKMASLNALRLEQARNYIYASNNFASRFFRIINLAKGDRPVFQERIMNEVSYGYIAQGGNPRRRLVKDDPNEILVDLHWLASEKVRYPLYDIYNGDVTAAALGTLDIAYDLNNKIDGLAYDLLTAGLGLGGVFGAFTVTGNAASRVYVANSRVVTGNLPTTNDLTASGASSSTKFNLLTLRTAVKYFNQWAGCFRDGDPRPTGIVIVPAIHATDLWEEVLPGSSVQNVTQVGEQLQQLYKSPDYGSVAWQVIPDNTLPATGNRYAYFVSSKPVGTLYFKPELAMEEVNTFKSKNYEERAQIQPIGMYIPVSHRVNICRVKFATT